ncbi:MAG: hypothetical protein AAFR03_09700 [Pseudomonadota bacterium]
MKLKATTKRLTLGAVSLALLSTASFAASAADRDGVVDPAPVETVAVHDAAPVADQEKASTAAIKKWGLGAAAAAVLAAIVRLTGLGPFKKAARIGGAVIREAAKPAVKVFEKVGESLSGPMRKLAIFASLAATALFGIGFYDLEWIFGLILGAGATGFAWAQSKGSAKPAEVRYAPASSSAGGHPFRPAVNEELTNKNR